VKGDCRVNSVNCGRGFGDGILVCDIPGCLGSDLGSALSSDGVGELLALIPAIARPPHFEQF